MKDFLKRNIEIKIETTRYKERFCLFTSFRCHGGCDGLCNTVYTRAHVTSLCTLCLHERSCVAEVKSCHLLASTLTIFIKTRNCYDLKRKECKVDIFQILTFDYSANIRHSLISDCEYNDDKSKAINYPHGRILVFHLLCSLTLSLRLAHMAGHR